MAIKIPFIVFILISSLSLINAEAIIPNYTDPLIPAGPNCKVTAPITDPTQIWIQAGGRADMSCPGNEWQWYNYNGNICYCAMGAQYDIFLAILFFLFYGAFFFSCYSLHVMKNVEKDKKIKNTPQFLVMIFNIFGLTSRMIMCIGFIDGRGWPVFYGDHMTRSVGMSKMAEAFSNLLIKIGQITVLSEFLLISLVWKTIVDASMKMKQIDKDADAKNFRTQVYLIVFMFVSIVPLSMASSYGIPVVGMVSNLIMLFFALGLVGGGTSYAIKLRKLLSGGTDTKQIKDGAKQKAVENIVNVVQISSLLCLVCLGAVGTNLFLGGGQTVENQGKQTYILWGWWFPIHFSEGCLFLLLAASTSLKARTSKSLSKQVGAGSSVASSTNESEKESEKPTASSNSSSHKK